MSLFLNQEDGYYSLTPAGMAAFAALIVILVLLTAFLSKKENADGGKPKAFSARQLVFSSAALALGFITSYIKVIDMPWGGSVTLCSMLFVVLIGYWYGPKIGLTSGFASCNFYRAAEILFFPRCRSAWTISSPSPLSACPVFSPGKRTVWLRDISLRFCSAVFSIRSAAICTGWNTCRRVFRNPSPSCIPSPTITPICSWKH